MNSPEASSHSSFKFTVSLKLMLLLITTAVLVGGAVLGITSYITFTHARDAAESAIETNLRVAWDELKEHGDNFRIEGDKLLVGETILNDDNLIPDTIEQLVGGSATIFMNDVRIATNIRNERGGRAVGTKLARGPAYDAVFSGKKYRGDTTILGVPYIAGYDPVLDSTGKPIGIVFVGVPLEKFYEGVDSSIVWGVLGSLIIGVPVILILLAIGYGKIAKPLKNVTNVVGELAKGKLETEVPEPSSSDEIADLLRALETFKSNAVKMKELEAAQKENEKHAAEERRALMHKMADDFDKSVKSVVSTVSTAATEMQSSARSMSATAEETSSQCSAVAAAAEETSANVTTVASAAEELNSSIGEITRQIGDSVKVAAACMTEAEATGAVMKQLNKSAEDIGNVVKLIEGIASQVNLLALNATIEAARAGDAGRGFAVVANEVKNLANQVAIAAKDITSQVEGIQNQTGRAVTTMETITSTIRQINETSTAIAAAAEEQGTATKEISRSIQETAQGTKEVTHNITGVSKAAAETGTSAGQLLDTAAQLAHESETLRRVVEEFISDIRKG